MEFEKIENDDYCGLYSLVGRKIINLQLSLCKQYLKFICEDCIIVWECEADCCSESWIEHVSIHSYTDSFTVESIETIDLGEVMPTRQDRDLLYGVKIHCGFADIFIEFRNSSNGYYGGSMRRCNNLLNNIIFNDIEQD